MAWRKSARGDGGLMPLLFALCALLAVAPGQAGALNAEAMHALTPAHIAALALLSSPEQFAADAPAHAVLPQRAALLLALYREAAAPIPSTPGLSAVQSAAATQQDTLNSRAAAHFALSTAALFLPPQTSSAPRRLHALVPSLSAHEAALLSGVRTNRYLS